MPDQDDNDEIDQLDLEEIQLADEGDAPEEPKALPPEEGVAELKRQLEAEKLRRENAERMAREASERERIALTDKDESDIHLVTNAIQTLNRDNEILKGNYAQAMRSGDFARAAEINDEISEAKAQLQQLQNGLEAMKAKPKPAAAPQHSDPVEAFASRLSARSADWVRAHPEFVQDSRLNRKMLAAHEIALADGHAADTDGYFAAIERTLNVNQRSAAPAPQEDASAAAAKVVSRRDAAPAAAPVGRGGSSSRPNVARLTAAEREMADMMGMKPEEYAKNKVALQREGKLQ